jgi:hypothetical protein
MVPGPATCSGCQVLVPSAAQKNMMEPPGPDAAIWIPPSEWVIATPPQTVPGPATCSSCQAVVPLMIQKNHRLASGAM